ncbi:MAG: glycoside hydrolase family 57 protein [Candidatus Diapherotrites archaeon]
MPSICLYFHVHQPCRLRKYSFFDIGKNHDYFDVNANNFYLGRIIRKCYEPTNRKLLELIERHNGRFKFCFSITGILLDQLAEFNPKIIDSFKALVDTGNVELFDETYYHSLAYLISEKEFKAQIELHSKKFKELFGVKPKVFRNTEAMYSNDIARIAGELGYNAIISEGLSNVLAWRSPNHLYTAKGSKIKTLLRNYKLSDDIAFRFSTRDWSEWPLTADKYASWLSACDGTNINLFMDYETFGEHQWPETGIFDFLDHLPAEALKYKNLEFCTASEILEKYKPVGEFDVPYTASWADVHRDLSAWLENEMQRQAFAELKSIELNAVNSRNSSLIDSWRKLGISDHFYYMCTKWFADGDVHKYFNPYSSPYDAFLNYMNCLSDLKQQLTHEKVKPQGFWAKLLGRN